VTRAGEVLVPWGVDAGDFPASAADAARLGFLVRYAVLAPSGHNTQPWSFRVGGDRLEVLADRPRGLPVVDPDDRELTVSCGAALGMIEHAARGLGVGVLLRSGCGRPPAREPRRAVADVMVP